MFENVDLYFHIKFKYLFWYKFMTISTALNMFDTIYNHRVSHFFFFVERWMNKSEIDFSFHFHSYNVYSMYWETCDEILKISSFLLAPVHMLCMTLRENILGNFITIHTCEKLDDGWKNWRNSLYVHEILSYFENLVKEVFGGNWILKKKVFWSTDLYVWWWILLWKVFFGYFINFPTWSQFSHIFDGFLQHSFLKPWDFILFSCSVANWQFSDLRFSSHC